MKIGIYCGLANNMYVFAHGLAEQACDICYIRDRSDRYPMSQPVWEDVAFSMGYSDVPRAASWEWSRWSEFEAGVKWMAPDWLYDPLAEPGGDVEARPQSKQGILDSLFLRYYLREPHRAPALRKMQSCDVLLVSGVEGAVLANASGQPYVIWPFGGDLMIAAGQFRPKLIPPWPRFVHNMLQRQLVMAYENALCVGAHEPTALVTDFYGTEHFLRKYKVERIAIPIATRRRADQATRREQIGVLLESVGIRTPSRRYLGFVPSRVDYEWKGQNRLLRAFARLIRQRKAPDIHLIFSGWGEDFENARNFVHEERIGEQVTFLDCALSKPLLYRFYLAADFIVDQFIVGMCGTSALEAMSCGAPVITWINSAVARPWGFPPVLQARTEEEIAAVLSDISEGRIDLEAAGARVQQWIARNYDPHTATCSLMAAFGGMRA